MSLLVSIGSFFAIPAAGRDRYIAQYGILSARFFLCKIIILDLLCKGKRVIINSRNERPP